MHNDEAVGHRFCRLAPIIASENAHAVEAHFFLSTRIARIPWIASKAVEGLSMDGTANLVELKLEFRYFNINVFGAAFSPSAMDLRFRK